MIPMPSSTFPGLHSVLFASKEAAIAHQDVISDNPKLFSDLITAISYVLDVQEDPRLFHAWRVAAVAAAMAEHILPGNVAEVFYAGLLHDVGGMGAFSHIIHYPTLYSQLLRPEVVNHPERGKEIIQGIPGLELCADFVAEHHEWYNGSGYPYRKAGGDIAPGAQLIRIADSIDLSRRFRPEVQPEDTAIIVQTVSGLEISPEVAEAFRLVISSEEFYRELVDDSRLYGLIERFESSTSTPIFPPNSDAVSTVLTVFARVVDSKHGFTAGHSERVSQYSVEISRAMGLSHVEVTKVKYAGLLHDAGKVAVPRSIIDKPGPLVGSEIVRVKYHPVLTMDILRNIAHLSELAWIAGHHHERWDGMGYPDGLRGEEIPLLSRILAVADALDAITSPRAYKEKRTPAEALQILHEEAGSQFDPQVVDAAHSVWGSGRLARAA